MANHIQISGIVSRRTQTLKSSDARLLEETFRDWLSLRGYTFQGTLSIVDAPASDAPMLA